MTRMREDQHFEQPATLDQLLTIQEVLARLSIGRTYLYEQIRSGHLRPVKLGRMTRFREAEVAAWLRGCRDEAGRPASKENGDA